MVRPYRVVKVPAGNVPSATIASVAEGVDARHGITVTMKNEDDRSKRRQRKRTGTV